MAYQTSAKSGVSTVDNNGGVAINVGNSTILTTQSLGSKEAATGSVVVDGTSTDKGLSSGTFAYNNTKPVAKRITTALATVTNTTLLSGALVPGQINSINKIQSVVTNKFTTAIRAGYFNIYNGKFVNTNTGGAYTVPSATDTFATAKGTGTVDTAANPTRLVPGSLRYTIGSKVAVAANYTAKTT